MREISFSDKTTIPLVGASVPEIARHRAHYPATRARNKSLVSLMSDVRKGYRREGLVWLVLALSAVALLALSFR